VTGRFDLLAVDDEAALAGVLEEDPDGASTYVLLLSRAFTRGCARSRRSTRCSAGCCSAGAASSAPPARRSRAPRDLAAVVTRHDGILGVETLDELAAASPDGSGASTSCRRRAPARSARRRRRRRCALAARDHRRPARRARRDLAPRWTQGLVS